MEKKEEGKELLVITAEDITKYLCPSATLKEVYMALNIIKSYNLNPFKREVHIIKYGTSPAQVVIGYEIYLKRAERTGKLDGFGVVLSADGETATCTIHRKDWKEPFVWQTEKAEFDKGQSTWKTMGRFMLKKVCLAQAFRICFSDEMGGLPYTREEVDTFMPDPNVNKTTGEVIEGNIELVGDAQEPLEVEPGDKPLDTRPISEAQRKLLFAKTKEKKIDTEVFKEYLERNFSVDSTLKIMRCSMDKILKDIDEGNVK